MHSRFAKLNEETWSDRKYTGLSSDARLMFLWSLSPPHSSVCGLYQCSLRDIESALGENPRDPLTQSQRAQLALRELSEAGMVEYDPTWQTLWVVNKVKYAATTPNAVRLMQKEYRFMPDCPLASRFIDRWGETLHLRK